MEQNLSEVDLDSFPLPSPLLCHSSLRMDHGLFDQRGKQGV